MMAVSTRCMGDRADTSWRTCGPMEAMTGPRAPMTEPMAGPAWAKTPLMDSQPCASLSRMVNRASTAGESSDRPNVMSAPWKSPCTRIDRTPLIPSTPTWTLSDTPDQNASILGIAACRLESSPPIASAATLLNRVKAGATTPPKVDLKLTMVASNRLATLAVDSLVRPKSPIASVDWARISACAARVLA